jgi:adenine-specific DNA-methyltransferase
MDSLTRLQDFFRQLFQFDLADLDFGLYRLFHLKRAEIEAFLDEQLPREVEAAFEAVLDEDVEQAQREYQEHKAKVLKNLGDDALFPDGSIVPQKRETALSLPLAPS